MKISILSDTHVSKLSPELVEKLKNLNLDLIIHCGDYTDVNVVHQLQALGNFCGVAGNMDSPEIKNILREKEVIEVEGKRIGIGHRYGGFFADRKLENKFQGEKIDIFIHGHTHQLRNEKKGDIYYLNPGPFPKSMLIINLEKDKEIEIEAMKL
jgi:putative phosphoesterase